MNYYYDIIFRMFSALEVSRVTRCVGVAYTIYMRTQELIVFLCREGVRGEFQLRINLFHWRIEILPFIDINVIVHIHFRIETYYYYKF